MWSARFLEQRRRSGEHNSAFRTLFVVQEVIAKRIIKAAMKGERDPARLRAAGLAALGYDREAI